LTVAVSVLLLAIGGYDPVAAARAMLAGAVGTRDALLSVTLVRAVPLILTGLAVALAFRAGVWNIGAEGQLYAGAIAGAWVGLAAGLPSWLHVAMVLGAAATAGALWALLPAAMKLRLGVGEVITTILLNFVAIQLTSYVVHGPLQEPRGVFPQTAPIAVGARLPVVVPGTRLHMGFLLAIVIAGAMAVFLRRTSAGFRVRAVGASEPAARVAGRIEPGPVILLAFLGSGALAGLAGGVEVAGVTYALYEGLSPGWGYTAIAVALLAGLNPLGVIGTGILFGALDAGAGAMQRDAGIPAVWATAVQAVIILSVLAVDQVRRRGGGSLVGRGPAPGGEPGRARPGPEGA
jgi:ABC-type uncharacterized transport system permease subunit